MYRRTNVSAVDRLSRRLEAQSNILVPPLSLGDDLLAYNRNFNVPSQLSGPSSRTSTGFGVLEDLLLLESLLDLNLRHMWVRRCGLKEGHNPSVLERQPSWVLEDVGGDA